MKKNTVGETQFPECGGKVSIALHKNFYTAPTESAVFMINNHVGAKGSDVIINYNHVGDKRISCFHDKQPCGRQKDQLFS